MSFKVSWLIEIFPGDQASEALTAEVVKQGYEVETFLYRTFDPAMAALYANDRCQVVQASVNLVAQIGRGPGIFCTWRNLRCTTYYAYWGAFLLQQNYLFLPLREVLRRRSELFEKFGEGFFLKPNNNDKMFAAQVFYRQDLEEDAGDRIALEAICTPETLLVVAPARKIGREWRLIMVEGKVVAATLYKRSGVFGREYCTEGCLGNSPST